MTWVICLYTVKHICLCHFCGSILSVLLSICLYHICTQTDVPFGHMLQCFTYFASRMYGILWVEEYIWCLFVACVQWLNLCVDMVSLVGEIWTGQTFRAVDHITVAANCKLRRIFTMKSQPPDTTNDYGGNKRLLVNFFHDLIDHINIKKIKVFFSSC